MKRIQSACVMQTLVFSQKPELGYTKETALDINRQEFEHYVNMLNRAKTRHIIVEKVENDDGSITVRVKKQYNATVSVSEYFN